MCRPAFSCATLGLVKRSFFLGGWILALFVGASAPAVLGAERGTLQVGAARVDITPLRTPLCPWAGMAAANRVSWESMIVSTREPSCTMMEPATRHRDVGIGQCSQSCLERRVANESPGRPGFPFRISYWRP